MSRIVSYWMPNAQNNMENGNQEASQRVGAVCGVQGQSLDKEVYLSLLANRLTDLLKREPDPEEALEELVSRLSQADLAPDSEDLTPENAGTRILQNGDLNQLLDKLGAPGPLPEKLPANNSRAERIYKGMELENWINSLLESQPNPDR